MHGVVRVGVISYDSAHLKTEQIVDRLMLRNSVASGPRYEIAILALPFASRAPRSVHVAHRPEQNLSIPTRSLASRYRLPYVSCSYDLIPDVADYYLIAGAGLFSPSAIGTKKIVNAHPGVIPSARGLDAFKWSLLNGVPLGVTLHYIDAEVDAGEVIRIFETPVYVEDTLATLARRHYELELDVLTQFKEFIDAPPQKPMRVYPDMPPQMRMPASVEEQMMAAFEKYKRGFAVVRDHSNTL